MAFCRMQPVCGRQAGDAGARGLHARAAPPRAGGAVAREPAVRWRLGCWIRGVREENARLEQYIKIHVSRQTWTSNVDVNLKIRVTICIYFKSFEHETPLVCYAP